MKKVIGILIILIFNVSIVFADEWTAKDTKYQAVFLLFKSVDYLQTKEIARNPKYYELNPIIGKHPTQNEIDIYFLSTAILHTGIAYYLPKKYRRYWQCVFIGMSAGCVAYNFNAGISIIF